MYHAILKSPPPIANIIGIKDNPSTKEEHISKINKSKKPKIPTKAFTLLKILPRSITKEMVIPATSPRKNPRKVPEVWLPPTESIDRAAAINIDFCASVVADAYCVLSSSIGKVLLVARKTTTPTASKPKILLTRDSL